LPFRGSSATTAPQFDPSRLSASACARGRRVRTTSLPVIVTPRMSSIVRRRIVSRFEFEAVR
jgi:hypothetical protein